MLALLVFSYACCGIGVWFGWYLRGRRARRTANFTVPRNTTLSVNGAVQPVDNVLYLYSGPHEHRAAERAIAVLTAQDSTE